MEFSDKSVNSTEKCMICLNPAWIKIAKIEKKERLDKFLCITHYTEFLEQFLVDKLDESILLFNQDSKMLEIPLYEAMERFGGLDEKTLLEMYIKHLDEKIQKIDEEISKSDDQFFGTLLQNEKLDKSLRKLLAQARIKHSHLE